MGGRGQRGSISLPISSAKWTGNLGGVIPANLKEAIGAKGAPNSIAESLIETNPHHSYSAKEFSENCQRCVVAYELNRRGYDVTALPTYRGDTLKKVVYYNPAKGTYEGRWKGAFRNAKTINVGSNTTNGVTANIRNQMKSFGDGSRAVVQIFYKGGGHVFNVENNKGRMVYVEAQTGKIKNINSTLKSVETMSVNLVRTDNLRLSDRARSFVVQR